MKKKKILAVLSAAMMSMGILFTTGIPTQAAEVGSSDEIIANDEKEKNTCCIIGGGDVGRNYTDVRHSHAGNGSRK